MTFLGLPHPALGCPFWQSSLTETRSHSDSHHHIDCLELKAVSTALQHCGCKPQHSVESQMHTRLPDCCSWLFVLAGLSSEHTVESSPWSSNLGIHSACGEPQQSTCFLWSTTLSSPVCVSNPCWQSTSGRYLVSTFPYTSSGEIVWEVSFSHCGLDKLIFPTQKTWGLLQAANLTTLQEQQHWAQISEPTLFRSSSQGRASGHHVVLSVTLNWYLPSLGHQ